MTSEQGATQTDDDVVEQFVTSAVLTMLRHCAVHDPQASGSLNNRQSLVQDAEARLDGAFTSYVGRELDRRDDSRVELSGQVKERLNSTIHALLDKHVPTGPAHDTTRTELVSRASLFNIQSDSTDIYDTLNEALPAAGTTRGYKPLNITEADNLVAAVANARAAVRDAARQASDPARPPKSSFFKDVNVFDADKFLDRATRVAEIDLVKSALERKTPPPPPITEASSGPVRRLGQSSTGVGRAPTKPQPVESADLTPDEKRVADRTKLLGTLVRLRYDDWRQTQSDQPNDEHAALRRDVERYLDHLTDHLAHEINEKEFPYRPFNDDAMMKSRQLTDWLKEHIPLAHEGTPIRKAVLAAALDDADEGSRRRALNKAMMDAAPPEQRAVFKKFVRAGGKDKLIRFQLHRLREDVSETLMNGNSVYKDDSIDRPNPVSATDRAWRTGEIRRIEGELEALDQERTAPSSSSRPAAATAPPVLGKRSLDQAFGSAASGGQTGEAVESTTPPGSPPPKQIRQARLGNGPHGMRLQDPHYPSSSAFTSRVNQLGRGTGQQGGPSRGLHSRPPRGRGGSSRGDRSTRG